MFYVIILLSIIAGSVLTIAITVIEIKEILKTKLK